ncbi:hypothetical protein IID27_03605, partial [Patescibacteria group bacterium]|nr:hypothetical protein [Patescibacteria group bacterium]
MRVKIITALVIVVMALTATAVFAGNYNSSLSNKSTAIVNQQVGDILLRYGIGGAEINRVTDALSVGISKADLKAILIEIRINENSVQAILVAFDTLGIGIDANSLFVPASVQEVPVTQTEIKQPYIVQPPTSVSGSDSTSIISQFLIKKCGVNTFGVSNECGVGAFKNLYFQCYDGYEEKRGGGSSCKSSYVWNNYARSVCANRCGAVSTLPSQSEQAPTEIPTKPVIEVKPIAICYIPDKLIKDYNRLLLDLRKAESGGDKALAEEIIKKIIALKLEVERYRKSCTANTTQLKPVQTPTETPSSLRPVAIDRCREVTQWESKIAYYEKLSNASNADLKEQTGFSREEIEKILANLPIGLKKVRVQCEGQRDFVEKRALGTFSTEILRMDLTSIAEPVKPVVVESGQEINDYYKARIEKITATEDTNEQIQNLRSLKEEINELIVKLIKGRKEMEISELTGIVTEIRISRGEIRADDVVVKTTDKKIFLTVGDRPASVEPTARGIIIRGWDPDGKETVEVEAVEISIKDNILRVGNSEVKLAASDVIESISKRSGRATYANITLKRGVVLKEENGRAVY